MKNGRLLWFGQVERTLREDWVKMCRDLVVEGAQSKDRVKKTWQECVNKDITQIGLTRCDAEDRTDWKAFLGNVQPALALKKRR
jgi:hypothetical protein